MIDHEALGGWLWIYTGEQWAGPIELLWSIRIGIGSFEIVFRWRK